MDQLLWAQLRSLLWTIIFGTIRVVVDLPIAIMRIWTTLRDRVLGDVGMRGGDEDKGVVFYEGVVRHSRRKPLRNSFQYSVRFALIELDKPPEWFAKGPQAKDHLTADEARTTANTSGKVQLLTNPAAAGYVQNPISVYYCYGAAAEEGEEEGALERCVAEVTNTPWGDRVRFCFDPRGDDVPKSLHVSPFMDMKSTWHLVAPEPSRRLSLTVLAQRHPVHGDFFDAHLIATRLTGPYAHLRNEEADLGTLIRFGYSPQRIACLIYWQAVKLLWKGARFYSPPSKSFRKNLSSGTGAASSSSSAAAASGGGEISACPFQWIDVAKDPWKTD